MAIDINPDEKKLIGIARAALESEADAIRLAAERLDGSLTKAVEIILNHNGKIVVTGVGKSGHIGHKIVATFNSTGTQAVFLHAVEAVHGDLGIYTPGDPTVMVSKSGSTAELVRLIPILRKFNSPLISIVGNLNSPLAQRSDVVIDATVNKEADPLHIVPTTSTTVALALGDVLATTLMVARRFTEQDFAKFHPAGQLGKNLGLTVKDVMHKHEHVAWVKVSDPIKTVAQSMTDFPLGAACVTGDNGDFAGLITEGDLRRVLQEFDRVDQLTANDIMTGSPVTIRPDMSLKDALHLMEDRPSQISVLPVMEKDAKTCLGLVRIHDIYLPNLY